MPWHIYFGIWTCKGAWIMLILFSVFCKQLCMHADKLTQNIL